MAKADLVPAAEKARAALLQKMTPGAREVATRLSTTLARGASAVVQTYFDIGVEAQKMFEDEGTFGQDGVDLLAEYLNIHGGVDTVRKMRDVVSKFRGKEGRAFVLSNTSRPMANGNFLTPWHWIHIARLDDADAQKAMLERALHDSLTARDLEQEVRAGVAGGTKAHHRQGGRKPKIPTSPVVGIRKLATLAQQFDRYAHASDEKVIQEIDQLDAAKVTKPLLTGLQKTRETVFKAYTTAGETVTKLDTNIERVTGILDKKYEEAEAAHEAEENGTAKASSNGHAGGKKKKVAKKAGKAKAGKAKAKVKRPVPVT